MKWGIFFAIFFLFLWVSILPVSNGIKVTEKTTFEKVDPGAPSFLGVYMDKWNNKNIKTNVSVTIKDYDWWDVIVDPKLKGTLLTVHPDLSAKIAGTAGAIKAKKVIIYVSSEDEKRLWYKWAKKITENYYKNVEASKTKPPLRKIVPEI